MAPDNGATEDHKELLPLKRGYHGYRPQCTAAGTRIYVCTSHNNCWHPLKRSYAVDPRSVLVRSSMHSADVPCPHAQHSIFRLVVRPPRLGVALRVACCAFLFPLPGPAFCSGSVAAVASAHSARSTSLAVHTPSPVVAHALAGLQHRRLARFASLQQMRSESAAYPACPTSPPCSGAPGQGADISALCSPCHRAARLPAATVTGSEAPESFHAEQHSIGS